MNVKPESALRRANELIGLGKKQDALDVLANPIAAKKYTIWTPKYEEIMMLYCSIAVQLRQNTRQTLMHYRTLTQQTHPVSFENVVREYIRLIIDATNNAAAQAGETQVQLEGAKVLFHAYAKDVGFSFEDQMYFVGGVGGEDVEDRSRRRLLAPWLKYQWDTYRNTLDILKYNNKLDSLYHEVIVNALEFCSKYNRVPDYKRLSELLRIHFQTIEKYQGQQHAVNLSSPEVIQAFLKTRFAQLEYACSMGVWAEALALVEDISSLHTRGLSLGFDLIDLASYQIFYERLVQIFWAAENHAYHACALRQLFHNIQMRISSEGDDKKGNESELKGLNNILTNVASKAVLSTLIVPHDGQIEDRRLSWGMEADGTVLSEILQFEGFPTRSNLVRVLAEEHILEYASLEVRKVFEELEFGHSPYGVYKNIKIHLDEFAKHPHLSVFVEPLNDLIILRLLERVARSYNVISEEKLRSMVPGLDLAHIERLMVDFCRILDFSIRIDHRNNLFYFSDFDVYGPRFSHELKNIALDFQTLATKVNPNSSAEKKAERDSVFKFINEGLAAEQKHDALRCKIAEMRKVIIAQEIAEKIRKEEENRLMQAKLAAELEEKRRKEELERLERLQKEKELKEKELKAKSEAFDGIKKKLSSLPVVSAELTKKVEDIGKNLEIVDRARLLKLQDEITEEEKKLLSKRNQDIEKRTDYFVRAIRIEEAPKVKQIYEEERIDDMNYMQREFQKLNEEEKATFQQNALQKDRLLRLKNVGLEFKEQIMVSRREEYEQAKKTQFENLKKAQQQLNKARAEKERESKEREHKRLQQLEEDERKKKLESDRKISEKPDKEKFKVESIIERKKQEDVKQDEAPKFRPGAFRAAKDKLRTELSSASTPAEKEKETAPPQTSSAPKFTPGALRARKVEESKSESTPAEKPSSSGKFLPRALREQQASTSAPAEPSNVKETPAQEPKVFRPRALGSNAPKSDQQEDGFTTISSKKKRGGVAKEMRIRGVLIDLSGTLHIEDSVIPGSIEALARLASIPGIKVKFVTNTTKESRKKLVTRLHRLGFHEIAESQLLTSLSATRTLITEQLKLKHPMLFLDPNAEEEFSDLKVNGAQTEFDSVVIGLAPDKFEYSRLNAAFRLIREKNVPLIATHKARYYREKGGVSLGPGAFVIGLEYATGVTAHVVGKPDPAFFLQVLQEIDCKPEEAIMIGDDTRDDIGGAQAVGIRGILVKTGKYSAGDEKNFGICPHFVANDFAAAVEYIQSLL